MIKKTFKDIEELLQIHLPANSSRAGRATGVSRALNQDMPAEVLRLSSHHKNPQNFDRYARFDQSKAAASSIAIDSARCKKKTTTPHSTKRHKKEVIEVVEESEEQSEGDIVVNVDKSKKKRVIVTNM